MIDINLSGYDLLLVLLVLCFAIFSIITIARYLLKSKSLIIFSSVERIRTAHRTKFARVSILRKTTRAFVLGILCSLVLVISAFNWTQYDHQKAYAEMTWEDEDIFVVEPPPIHPPKPKPPPPPVEIVELPEDEIDLDEEIEFEDMMIEESTNLELTPIAEESVETEAPMPAMEYDEPDEVVVVAERYPRFPGCEEMAGTHKEKEACSKKKLMEFIYDKIRYPAIAQENGIEGMCVVRFIVEKDGSVSNLELLKDIGGGCGAEALRVTKLMQDMEEQWVPGRQRGRAVRVQYNLPIRFKIVK